MVEISDTTSYGFAIVFRYLKQWGSGIVSNQTFKIKNMNSEKLFERLWHDYISLNPEVKAVHDAFVQVGEKVVNDHIAFRTFNHPRLNIDKLSKIFTDAGYVESGNYRFEAKKLLAKHFEKPDDALAPRVFISQLILEEFSPFLQTTINQLIERLPDGFEASEELIFAKDVFAPASYSVYEKLRLESEYAAWVYVYGFRANHFTVNVNELNNFKSLQQVNEFLKGKGFKLNESGGEIKGKPEELLEQSSTMAGLNEFEFSEGKYTIPGCYYEFALRYADADGKRYSGFIAKSADKIFESTDFYAK